jgi:hypothetical protein
MVHSQGHDLLIRLEAIAGGTLEDMDAFTARLLRRYVWRLTLSSRLSAIVVQPWAEVLAKCGGIARKLLTSSPLR